MTTSAPLSPARRFRRWSQFMGAFVGLLFLSPFQSSAAPSTELSEEFYTGLEHSPGGFALIDKKTGQIRIGSVDASNRASFTGPFRTHQPAVTAVSSGFRNGGGTEQIALSSVTANRVVFAPVDGSATTPYFPQQPGPDGVSLYRENAIAPDRLLLHCLYGAPATSPPYEDDYLEASEDANLGSPTLLDEATRLPDLDDLQALYLNGFARREAAAVWDSVNSPALILIYDDTGNVRGTLGDPLPAGTRLASNVRDVAANLMVVGYVPGSQTLTLVTINTGGSPWQPVTPFPTDVIPFPVGKVAAATGAGAPNGILITSQDGSQAAYGQIVAGGTQVNILQNFNASDGQEISSLVAIPGRGIMLLEGPGGGPSSSFVYQAWDGAQFVLRDAGALPPLLPPQTDFATILWYDAEPLVDPNANLLQLNVEPDWANGTGALPSPLSTETFVSSAAGLDNPVPLALPPPTGASHVITNQLLDTCSFAVLRPNSALLDPPLTVVPASGSYNNPILIEADSIDTVYDIFYREDRAGVPWRQYNFAFGVGYPSTWLFYAKDKATGATGPIVSRTYNFDPAAWPLFDSDNDGAPDYVEQWQLLDPNGGSDSDGDLQSDMEEILDGNDPNDITDFEPTATRNPPFIGEGFLLIAQAHDTAMGEASPGETIEVRNMSSAVLDDAPVEQLTTPAVLAGQLGAPITVNTPVSLRHWAILNSPLYFGLGNVPSPPRDGREIYRLLQIPDIPLPTINPVLGGTDLAVDGSAWLTAAQAAYAAYEPVTSITNIAPVDTAVAVLGEAALYDALLALGPATQAELGVPQDIPADPGPPATPFIPGYSLFTLFGERDKDGERTHLNEPMIAALETDGLSFNNLLSLLDPAVAAAANLQTLVAAIYDWHVLHSDPDDALNYMPGLPLPLDVLRGLVRGGDLPFEVAPDPPGPPNWDYRPAATQALVNAAKAELAGALALLPGAYRPADTWIVEVGTPTIPGQKYGYTNLGTLNPAVLLNEFGEFINLDQGLGLALGARFSVQGYTDVSGPAGHDAIEAIAVAVQSVPLASDSDLNANLLDDQWEEFFFGSLGVVGPFDLHPVSGLTYLAYHLAGADPRDDSMDPPALNVLVPETEIFVLPNNNYGLEFEFPDQHFDAFEWGIVQSTTLQGFIDLPEAIFTPLGGDLYQVDLGVAASSLVRNFFRMTIALKNP